VAPDGRRAVWVRVTVEPVDGELTRVSNLWLTPLPPEEADPVAASRPLTRGRGETASPRFSPDGRWVAYLSDRPSLGDTDDPGDKSSGDDEPKAQVWVLPLDGGEPSRVTAFDRPVSAFGWAGDGALVVLAGEARGAWDLAVSEAKDRAVVVDDAEREAPVRLYRVALGSDGSAETVRRLTRHADWGESLAVSPDGRRAVLRSARSLSYEYDSRVPPVFRLVDLATGESRELGLEDPSGRPLLPEKIVWQHDSSGFYVLDELSRHERYRVATVSELHHHDLASGATRRVDLGHERGLGGPREMQFAVVPDGVYALLADGVDDRLAFFERRGGTGASEIGWVRHDLALGDVDRLVAAPDGSRLLLERSTATTPSRWYAAALEPGAPEVLGEPVALTRVDPRFDGKSTGRVEAIEFPGARGETVQGLLHYPLDWSQGEAPRPLVLDVHGGPAARDRDAWSQRWAEPLTLWRQRGAFVLQVNYHGSSGYGLDWASSIAGGNYYDLEVPDLEAGVDAVIERGLVDPERLGAAGWSNGGILIAELLTRTGRYKAASIGAADVEWASDYGNVDFGASFDEYYFGAPPWEAPELYAEKSPFFRLDRVVTPTIVFTGTADTNVPPHQSRSLFRALQQIGKAPTRLVLFPDEPHSLQKPAHQRRKIEEDLAWFDRHLFGRPESRHPAVRAGSLLAGALARRRARRDDDQGVLGVDAGGALVPEIVPVPLSSPGLVGLRVARFEVTRAQWTVFDPATVPEPGREDHPATGMPFERAQGYAAWLASTTGRAVRLPTVAEAGKLAELGRRSASPGNTLDRWAGYSPNPDDARRLAEAAAELPGDAPLLLPVGSLGGVGEDPVFDLDGNAATWAVADDGTGVAVGPSADRPAAGRTVADEAASEYRGIRIVEEV
jgi:dipeptidyl aminopeptidase/acylaminoacyl peptidase